MKQVLTHPVALVVLGVVLGIAYGNRIPVVATLAKKLPGASV